MNSTGHTQQCGAGHEFIRPSGCAYRRKSDHAFSLEWAEQNKITFFWTPCRDWRPIPDGAECVRQANLLTSHPGVYEYNKGTPGYGKLTVH